MRKILLIVIIVLLLVFGIMCMAKGVQIGNLRISSIQEIGENSEKLDSKVLEINQLIDTEFPNRKEELKEASKRMQEARQNYLNEISLSSNDDLSGALQIFSMIQRLFTRLSKFKD